MAVRSKDFHQVLESLKAFEKCHDVGTLQNLVMASVAQYGFSHVSVMAAETKINKKSGIERTLLSSWPKAWFEQYHAQDLRRHDPVAAMTRSAERAFRWSDATATTAEAKYVMDAACHEHKLKHGICVPIRNFEGVYAAASFAGEDVDQSDSGKFFAELVAIYAFNSLSNLTTRISQYQVLTDRQREIMKWVAAGKTAWDVGVILHISVHTVNKTIANAMERLDVRTRAQAIAEAIRRGEISP